MTTLKRLDTEEQFNDLKKGQEIVVNWKEGSDEHRKGNKVGRYKMIKVSDDNELILKVKGNIYFNIGMYLKGKSSAEDVAIVVPEADILRQENERLHHIIKNSDINQYKNSLHLKIFMLTEEMAGLDNEGEEWLNMKIKYDAYAEVWNELKAIVEEGDTKG